MELPLRVAEAQSPCAAPRLYRPRHPEATLHYRLVADHLAEFLALYEERFEKTCGRLRPVVRRVAEQYLDCGVPKNGFARVRCPQCRFEFLVPYSCRTRNFCPSCQQKRSILWAEWLVRSLLAPVPHVQWVFSIPRAIRGLFARDRRLLSLLSRTAYDAVLRVFRAALEEPRARPGVVASIQTFADPLHFNPHLHLIASEGAFLLDGAFLPLPFFSAEPVGEVFRRLLLHRLHRAGRLSEEFLHKLLAWEPSGFHVHNEVRVKPDDPEAVETLARYVTRAPLSLQKLSLDSQSGAVLYRSKFHPRLGRDFEKLDPLEFLARITSHIPDPRSHLVRYYGAYSCRARISGRFAGGPRRSEPARPSARERKERQSWARLLRKVFEVDPLRCSRCGAAMRLVAFLTDPRVIDRILDHLERRPSASPRAPPPTTAA